MTQVADLAAEVERILAPLSDWAKQCHSASLKVVKANISPVARVARGSCLGVGGQHSWVVLGDPYAYDVPIIDPTLWSYDDTVEGVWVGNARTERHRPHGAGSIFTAGKPHSHGGPVIELDADLSPVAKDFLRMVGPLDIRGWRDLAHCPVQGWPAKEVITAMYADKRLRAFIPIDIVGILTDVNPGELYLSGKEQA